MSDKNIKSGKYEFKAEVKQLLNILVHSLYTNREIFLRELVSNASDALDKLRFESTKGSELADKDIDHEIRITFDKDKKLLWIKDSGIGMTSEEIINNIGTIAKSGTADFLEQLSKNKEDANNIIGKFGVGFYSVFMVADKVEITSKSFKADEPAVKWVSDGLGSYELSEPEEEIKRGTTIQIHLKEDADEFADDYRLKNIVKTHSNFITFPIFVGDEKVNTVSALWREPKSSVKKEQYDEFYKFLTYDSEPPLKHLHISVDAPIQFNALLYIPKKSYDFMGLSKEEYGLDLYVKRVLIQHRNKDLLPEYLGFVKGIVDSEDLPLNISRETLQENVIFSKISSSVTSQVYSALKKMAEDEIETYNEFWKEHSKFFKMGYGDFANREKYIELLRFNSSINEDSKSLVSLKAYTERMKSDQKEIYYKFGNSREAIELDPHLEIFTGKGIEVLYLFDPVDEFVMSTVAKYNDFDLVAVDQADLKNLEKLESVREKKKEFEDLSDDDEKHLSSLLSKMKDILGDRIKEVKVSERLESSPACLVNPETGMSASMQKIMKIMNKDVSVPQFILEVNKDHKLVRNMLKVFKADSNDNYIAQVVEQIYESALLLEGYLYDPYNLVNRINNHLEQSSDWYVGINKL